MTRVILQPGQRLHGERGGDLLVLEWVGEGSYARVYRAEADGRRQTGDGSGLGSTTVYRLSSATSCGLAALKLAKTEVGAALNRLRREQEAHAHLTHPAIPALLDAGIVAGAPWLARQWVEGESLRRRLDRTRGLPLVQAVPILLRVADAVAAVHDAGWAHGDLRPDNVLLEAGTGQAFLLDLGDACPRQAGENGRSALTETPDTARAPASAGGRRRAWRWTAARANRPAAEPASAKASRVDPRPAETSISCCLSDDPASRDLRQLGELLAWALAGVDPGRDPDRLSRGAGYPPIAVQLWHDARAGRLPSAAAFRDPLQRLARQLGLPANQ